MNQNAPTADGDADTHVAIIAQALATLNESERRAVVEHVRRLVKLSPAKRQAIFTLARE